MNERKDRFRAAQLAALACLAVLALAAPAQGAPSWTAAPSTASAREALRFWTPARMRQAQPLEARRREGGGLARVSGTLAADDPPGGDGTPAASEFTAVSDSTAPEFRQNGAVFIVLNRFFGVSLGRCSGTAVHSANRSVVITAGHCVNQAGRWFNRDWIFVPGYHDGVRPFGVFVAKWLGATSEWVDEESSNADVGAAVVSRNERGQRLTDAVGGYEIAFGRSPRQVFDIHGYPAEAPFDGTSQRLCAGTPFLGHDFISFLQPGPLNLAVECELTGGASGGGWTIEGDVLNGVTSYGYGDEPVAVFGPYFGGAVRNLYGRASGVR